MESPAPKPVTQIENEVASYSELMTHLIVKNDTHRAEMHSPDNSLFRRVKEHALR